MPRKRRKPVYKGEGVLYSGAPASGDPASQPSLSVRGQTGALAADPTVVLIVDDEPDLRDLLTTSLRFAGFDAHSVASGRAALDILADRRVDLVVMDVMMPALDGLTAVRKLRARGDDVPVLFLTAKDEADDASTTAAPDAANPFDLSPGGRCARRASWESRRRSPTFRSGRLTRRRAPGFPGALRVCQ